MDDPILEAARAIRPYLRDLLPPDVAAELDFVLGQLLVDNDVGALRDALKCYPATREWTAECLALGLPPDLALLRESSSSPPPGHGDPVGVPKYVCRFGDYTFYRHAVGQPIPTCPTHHCDLDKV